MFRCTAILLVVLTASSLSAQTQVTDLPGLPTSQYMNIGNFVKAGDVTYFAASGEEYSFTVWRTDGTTDGTQPVLNTDFLGDAYLTSASGVTLLAGTENELYFIAAGAGYGIIDWDSISSLCRTDGTVSGTVHIARIPGFYDTPEAVISNGKCYISNIYGTDGERDLWVTDGTAAGTFPVTHPDSGRNPADLTVVGDSVYFTAFDADHGRELWITDGEVSGTTLVADLNPGTDDGLQTSDEYTQPFMAALDGKLIFAGNDGVNGTELWATDGTTAGTTMLADIHPGVSDGNPRSFAIHDNALYFGATGQAESALWTSDGTPGGTIAVKVFDFQSDYFPTELSSTSFGLMFSAPLGSSDSVAWLSDGTTQGTTILLEGRPFIHNPRRFTSAGDNVYFFGQEDVSPYNMAMRLYRTDGTSAGTAAFEQPQYSSTYIRNSENKLPVKVGSTLLLPHWEPLGLWRISDGKLTDLKQLTSDAGGMYSQIPGALGSNFVFSAASHGENYELWVSNGTRFGTRELVDILSGPDGSYPRDFVSHDGKVFFEARNANQHTAIWQTDGTAGGTVRVTDLVDGAHYLIGSLHDRVAYHYFDYHHEGTYIVTTDGTKDGTTSFPVVAFASIVSPKVVDGLIYFLGVDLTYWVSDGTPEGTVPILSDGVTAGGPDRNFHKFRDNVFFVARTDSYGSELHRTDGTAEGTSLVHDSVPGDDFTFLAWRRGLDAANTDDLMIYAGTDGENGLELWATDGTSNGTEMLKDIFPGPESGAPWDLTPCGGRVYFGAFTESSGRELWTSDGTEAGTRMVVDICPGPFSSNPGGFYEFDGMLYFSASDGIHGRELWRTDGTAQGTERVSDINAGVGDASPYAFFDVDGSLYFQAYTPESGREFWRYDPVDGGGPGSGCVVQPGNGGALAMSLFVLMGLAWRRGRAWRRAACGHDVTGGGSDSSARP